MREGLKDAIAVAGHEEGYAKGSVVICQHCLKPLYRLTRSISVGERANRTADAYRPISVIDLEAMTAFRGRSAGVSAAIRSWTPEQRLEHCQQIPALKSGSPALCPACQHSFVRVRAPERGEVVDQAYTWELFTIPPEQAVPSVVARRWATEAL